MKLNRKERVVYFLSLSQDTAVEDIPEYCASLEMEILMPKDPAQWVTFKSMFEEELPGRKTLFKLGLYYVFFPWASCLAMKK